MQRLPGAGLVARKFNFIEFFNCEFHGDSGGGELDMIKIHMKLSKNKF